MKEWMDGDLTQELYIYFWNMFRNYSNISLNIYTCTVIYHSLQKHSSPWYFSYFVAFQPGDFFWGGALDFFNMQQFFCNK